jgi:methyl-accepting chemotaxis protein
MISFFAIGIFPLIFFALISVYTANNGLKSLAQQQLESVRDIKKTAIERYFQTIDAQVVTLSDTQVILQAMFYLPTQVKTYQTLAEQQPSQLPEYRAKLSQFYQQQHPTVLTQYPQYIQQLSPTALLMQTDYLLNNPHALSERWKLNKGQSATAYHAIHTSMQPVVAKFIQNAHFLDLFLVDIQTDTVLYSVNKSVDFGVNLSQPPLEQSGLANAYFQSKNLAQSQTHFTDFNRYAPAQDLPVAFISTPVVYEGKTLGLLVVQIDHSAINQILFDQSGMGKTGETFLVGSDKLLRTNAHHNPSVFNINQSFAKQIPFEHPAVNLALKGQSGIIDSPSYTQTPTLTAYAPLNIKGVNWAILAEMQNAEAFAASNELFTLAVFIVMIAIFITILIAFVLARNIATPIHALVNTLNRIHQTSDFTLRHQLKKGQDSYETQQASQALNALMDSLQNAFSDIEKVMSGIAKGQFNQRVQTPLNGDLNQLKDFVNQSANSVESTMNALSLVMKGMADGQFSVRLDECVQGELKHQVDFAMAQMEKAILSIAEAMESAAKGNFSHRVQGDLRGDMARLKTSVNQSLTEIQSAVDEITLTGKALAKGDLTLIATGHHEGELDELQHALNDSIHHLNSMIEGVRQAADTVTQGANDISESSLDLNQRTQQQALSLEQTTASMAQMTHLVRDNPNNAQRASDLSNNARSVTQKGVEVMQQTIAAMKGIETASQEINDIIALIDSVAFQTNLLALNAAVEAARAGEAGRGFAVVASEVRNLASRSAEAARQIKTLITHSGQQINQGTRLVNQTSSALNDINQAILQVNDIVADISHASAQQATRIDQVNQAMTDMDNSTQQNAMLVRSLSENANSVNQQAQSLAHSVASFTTQRTLR